MDAISAAGFQHDFTWWAAAHQTYQKGFSALKIIRLLRLSAKDPHRLIKQTEHTPIPGQGIDEIA